MPDKTGVLFIGDIIGRPGRQRPASAFLPGLREKYAPALRRRQRRERGRRQRASPRRSAATCSSMVDVLTSGNHIWDKKEGVCPTWSSEPRLLRPANYPPVNPGPRDVVRRPGPDGRKLGVLNLQGRVFMEPLDCPFRTADAAVEALRARDARASSSTSTPRRRRRSRPWAGTSTAGSRPSSARTPTSRRPTSGSCPAARPTSPTSAWPAAVTRSSASHRSRPSRSS